MEESENGGTPFGEYKKMLQAKLKANIPSTVTTRVFGYSRFSTLGQHESSIERQETSIRAYADRENLTIDRLFADRGVSGALSERAELDKMIAACSEIVGSRRIIVIVESMDRLVRSIDAFAAIHTALARVGAVVHEAYRGEMDDFQGPIQAAFAAADRNRIVQRLNAGKRQLVARGGYIGPLPTGYRRDGTGMLAVDPESSKLVIELFERRAEGETISSIVKDLNERGVPAPKSKYWHRSTVSRLLTNTIYIGLTARRPNG